MRGRRGDLLPFVVQLIFAGLVVGGFSLVNITTKVSVPWYAWCELLVLAPACLITGMVVYIMAWREDTRRQDDNGADCGGDPAGAQP